MTLIRIPVFVDQQDVDDRQVCCLFVLVMRFWCSDDAMLMVLLCFDESVMAYRLGFLWAATIVRQIHFATVADEAAYSSHHWYRTQWMSAVVESLRDCRLVVHPFSLEENRTYDQCEVQRLADTNVNVTDGILWNRCHYCRFRCDRYCLMVFLQLSRCRHYRKMRYEGIRYRDWCCRHYGYFRFRDTVDADAEGGLRMPLGYFYSSRLCPGYCWWFFLSLCRYYCESDA